MTVPRGFTRCDECEGKGEVELCRLCRSPHRGTPPFIGCSIHLRRCPSCSGSGLVPTEKLREEAAGALYDANELATEWVDLADAVLRKVAEHIGEER